MELQNCLMLVLVAGVSVAYASTQSELPGHHKPFGYGATKQVEEVQGFIPVKEFFSKYARKNRPVVMRGAVKVWPAYENWKTDEYFKSVSPKDPYMVGLDKKKGNPDQMSKYVDFKEFIDIYNTSTRRMVEFTPEFLLPDVLIPSSLDCDAITQGEILMGNKMWFGSKYAASVVHKDAADNINCLVYGVKNYTMIPIDQSDYVLMDRPDGLYSTMLVDDVDFEKFPGLEKVDFQISELQGGDCIFVPYKWIHQVRSYGRNIAVNIWWNYWKNDEFDLDKCPDTFVNRSISEAKFHGWGDFETRDEGVKEHTIDMISMLRRDVDYNLFARLLTVGVDQDDEVLDFVDEDILQIMKDGFEAMDINKDGKVNSEELKSLPEDNWKKVIHEMKLIFYITRTRASEVRSDNKFDEYEKEFEARTGRKLHPEAGDPLNTVDEGEVGRPGEKVEKEVQKDTKHDEF